MHSRGPLSHWSTLVEGLQASPQECYAAIEAALRRREIPGAGFSLVTHKESGFLSAERLYLRVSRKMLGFDICAAPFGTGFFFSWRTFELPPANFFGCLVVILMLAFGSWLLQAGIVFLESGGHSLNIAQMVVLSIFLLMGVLWITAVAVRSGKLFSEDAVLAMPVFGPLYNLIFRPSTFYKLDTIDMYEKAVHAAVLEVVDGVIGAKGLRSLSADERLPTLREFLGRK